jgi:ParB-like chromosome segregation protein Spo0J
MQIKDVAVNNLIPYAKNSRTHSPEQVGQIAASIKEFGFRNPILVDGVGIIAGHGRLMAAQKLGLDKVPTIDCSDMTESQKKAYIIADNKLAMNAGWDTAMLSIEMKDLEDEGFDLALLGFDDKELNALLEPEVTEGLTDEDAVPDVPEEPKTKVGDIYILGNHRLMCGDSCSITDMEKLVNSRQVDMWLTDPTYNEAY